MIGYAYLIVFAAVVLVCEASDCCSSYTHPITRAHVDGKVCDAYCCITSSNGIYDCCNDVFKQAPVEMRDADCSHWLKEHMFVSIVGGILFLVLLVTLCTCCCCCCACLRNGKSHSVIVTGACQPSSVVVASHQHQQMIPPTNAAHYGYDQN